MNEFIKNKYFLIGIKGAGMSALANFLLDLNCEVSGSDVSTKYFTEKTLNERNVRIYSFDENSLCDEYIYIISPAYDAQNNKQVKEVVDKKYEFFYYHDFLSMLSKEYKSIAVAGTHGKTTTTSLIASVIGRNVCNYIIGDGSGRGNINSKILVFEACEYKDHFLKYFPNVGVILNIDYDHPDYFVSIESTIESYKKFSRKCNEKIVVCKDDENIKVLIEESNGVDFFTYGLSNESNVYATNIVKSCNNTSFDIYVNNKIYMSVKLPIYGEHMIRNVLATICVAVLYDISVEKIIDGLEKFKMPNRRFQIYKTLDTQIIMDDYGHHPNEIKATRKAIEQMYPNKKIVCIFQPHTFSRTKTLFNEFIVELNNFYKVYITEIFSSAREADGEITSNALIDKITNAEFISENDLAKLNKYENSILLFIGAGNINTLMKKYVERI